MQDSTTAGAMMAPAKQSIWREEIADTVRLSWPMALTQLGQIAMMTSDLALLGRLGGHVVAAVALAHTVLFVAFVLGMGLVSAVAPLASQAFGARQPRMVRRALRVGLWTGTLLGVPLTLAQHQGEALLLALGQSPETSALAAEYLYSLAWCLVPGWWFIAIRGFMGAVNRPEPAMWITLAAIPANFILAYALIYGALGLPRMELFGAGLATTLVNVAMCVAAIWAAYALRPFKKFRILGNWWRGDWRLLGELVWVGLPISGSFLLEYGIFAAAALLMGVLGTVQLAAHQVALQVASIMFMVPFGISMAATVRVGHAAGRRDPHGTHRAGIVALGLAATFMATMTVLVALFRQSIPLLFVGDAAADAEATRTLAATLLILGASFFIADGLQTVAAGALRGLNDTRIPLLFAALCFWAIGFAACYLLGFAAGWGAVGIWVGLSLAVILYAALLVWRFHRLTKRGYLPDLARE
jgi:MATE family multidrug resistance protein